MANKKDYDELHIPFGYKVLLLLISAVISIHLLTGCSSVAMTLGTGAEARPGGPRGSQSVGVMGKSSSGFKAGPTYRFRQTEDGFEHGLFMKATIPVWSK